MSNTVYDFKYTGSFQTFTAPHNGKYKLEAWGAQGGDEAKGGKGGYATGVINLQKDDILYVYVGQNGYSSTSENAFNGGGEGSKAYCFGGGATDFRLYNDPWNSERGLLSRILVAGGGGSIGTSSSGSISAGGAGGGTSGCDTSVSTGGSQKVGGNSRGAFGIGGNGKSNYSSSQGFRYGGAGGSGWFGGGGNTPSNSASWADGGAGGSGYALTDSSYKPSNYYPTVKYYLIDTKLINGDAEMPTPTNGTTIGRSGDGYAKITLLEIANNVPTISGNDENLGEKNLAFTLSYSVNDIDGNELTIIEKLNGNTINTIINPELNKDYTLSITKEMMDKITINSENIIEISVTDGQATAYRRYKFTKTNVPPTITVSSVDLGIISERPPTITYTVNDLDNDVCTVVEKINSKVTKTYTATLAKVNTFNFEVEEWLKVPNGTNKVTIEATDSKGNVTAKDIYFTKLIDRIEVLVKNPIQTSIAATKILVTPKWNIEGGTGEVWACNNAFDTNPTWENITTMINLNRPYIFTNKDKTASNWGIGIKFKISKNSGYNGEIALLGFGGAYE